MFKEMKDNELYENRMYFIAQMYEEKWTPRDTKVEFDDGTVYGGAIKKYYGQPASA